MALPLIACLVIALALLVTHGAVVGERAYVAFQAARDGGLSSALPDAPVYLALLAGAGRLGLPIPSAGLLLSAAGWLAAIIAVYVIGLRWNRPMAAAFAAGALTLEPALPPLLGQGALFVMGWLWGAVASLTFPARIRPASRPANLRNGGAGVALAVLVVSAVYHASRSPASILWASYGAAALPGLALLAGLLLDGLITFVTRHPLAWSGGDRCACGASLVALALIGLGYGRGAAQAWTGAPRQAAAERLALWEQAGLWLQKNTPPASTVWSDAPGADGALGYFSGRRVVNAASPDAPPDYAVAANSLAWTERTGQPGFQEHYKRVTAIANPYDSLAPLMIYRYRPSPFDIGSPVHVGARLGEALELLDYCLDSTQLIAGEAQHLTLTWRALEPLTDTFYVRVRLYETAGGQTWAQVDKATPANLRTRLWPVDRPLTDRYTLEIPDDLPPGAYQMQVQVLYAENEVLTGVTLDHFLGEAVTLAQLEAQPWISDKPMAADWPITATFGDAIELVGYSLRPIPVRGQVVERGGALRVRLYWRALAAPGQSYHVFTHLIAADGHLAAQSDSAPVYETFPTDQWQAGQYILDEHIIPIDQAVPAGRYWLQVGLYAPDSNDRLAVRNQAGQEIPGGSLPLIQVDVE